VEVRIGRLYVVELEEQNDFIFEPVAVVPLLVSGHFRIYSPRPMHNRIRATLQRHSWTALEQGVTYDNAEYRLTDLAEDMKKQGWEYDSCIPDILRHLYTHNPRQYFFLRTHLSELG